jgi:hypothetical protein
MKMNKNLIIGILIILSLLYFFLFHLLRCVIPDNPKERNKIIFKESILNVQDSLHIMTSYLKRIPVYKEDWVEYCIVNKNVLCVNFKRIGSIDSLLLTAQNTPIQELKILSKEDQLRFLCVAKYLNENYLYRVDYYKRSNYLECCYREFKNAGDYQNDLMRFITLGESLQNFDKNRYQIIDTNQNLILYADKDAKIWEGEKK